MKRLLLAGVSAAALLWPMTAHAEPISTFIATTFAVSAVTAAAITSAIVSIAVSLVLTGITMLLAGKPSLPKPSDGQVPLKQPVPPIQYGVGRTRMSGSYTWFEAIGGGLYYALAVKDGIWDTIERRYFNDDAISVTGPPFNLVIGLPDGRYANNSAGWMEHTGGPLPPGTPLESNPLNVLVYYSGGGLDANFLADGVTAIGVVGGGVKRSDFGTRFPYGQPQASIAGKTTRIFDPRDPTQNPDDPTTWKWSANAILIRLWYEVFCPHGPRRLYQRAILPRLATWIAQANACDEVVPTKASDPVPRYECGFWWQSTMERAKVRGSMMASADAWDCELGDGSFISIVGKYIPPVETLTDDDITGYSLDSGALDADYVNSLVVKFTDREADYGEQDAPAWQDDEAILEFGLRATEVDLWPVQNQSQARRLAKRLFDRANAPLRGTLTTTLASLRIIGDRWVRVQSDKIAALANAVIEIKGQKTDLLNLRRTIEFVVVNANTIDAWDPETDEGDPPPNEARPGDSRPGTPTGVAAVAEAFATGDGVTGIRLRVSWDQVSRSDLTWSIRYRQTGETSWVEQAVTDPALSGGLIYATTAPVAIDEIYDVQIRAEAYSTTSNWTSTVTASTSTASIAPASPTGLSAMNAGGSALLNWTAPRSTNFATCNVYRASGPGGSFGSAILVTSGLSAAPGSAMSYQDYTVADGGWTYWVTALNVSGAASLPSAPADTYVSSGGGDG